MNSRLEEMKRKL